jgi:hypothetical protein
MDKIEFSIDGVEYVIQNVDGENYKEIVYKKTGQRVENEKDVCRKYGIDVPTDANVMNTHQAIELLIDKIKSGK